MSDGCSHNALEITMTRSRLMVLAAMTFAISAAPASAQRLQMTLKPDSKLVLAGSSNVHDWSCKSDAFIATVEVDTGFTTHPFTEVAQPISKVAVTIPLRTLKCGHKKMDSNMYEALNAEQYPDIKYTLSSYTVDLTAATADTFVANTIGDLTVAGKTIKVALPIKTERQAGGSVRGTGTVNLKMTDFGIKPPVALLGTLRTRDAISISFDVLLDKSIIVALSNQP
jgi:polyisoprenoid-binding protein YceI